MPEFQIVYLTTVDGLNEESAQQIRAFMQAQEAPMPWWKRVWRRVMRR